MIILKEEFKAFVRKRPELIKYVNSGDMTWQKFYEQWSLYGEDENVWKDYKNNNSSSSNAKQESFNLGSIADMIKKVDMNSVQKGVNSLQKIIELLQGFTTKDVATSSSKAYEPRQLFKKFED